MQNTTNYNLKKPDVDDFYNIQDFNDNADIIDIKIKELTDGKSDTNHTHNYAGSSTPGGSATTSLACTGNSATATKLATQRTINGINFDGSANLSNYASTGGTSTAYTCTITGASYVNGLEITILPHTDCGANATLNVNSLGALTIKNSSGETLKAGDIKSGVPVSLVRVGSYFFIRGGGGKTKPNIFVQATEPTSKDGIWIKNSGAYDGVIELADQAYFDSGVGYIANTNIPYNFDGSAVEIGTDIYLFGGYNNPTTAYKYSTTTDVYTLLTKIPYNFSSGSSVAIGTDIYLLGGYYNGTTFYYNYKYDTIAGTYTKLTSIPFSFEGSISGAAAVGTDIYLFGSENSTYYKYAYKYGVMTNSYTRLADIPYEFTSGSVVSVGTNIHLLGGHYSDYYHYIYNTLSNSYTKLANIPYSRTRNRVVVVGTDIYLFGSSGNSSTYYKYAYKYGVMTNSYTRLADIPYEFAGGNAVTVNDYIYLLGGSTQPTYNYKYGAFIFSPNKIIFKANPYPTAYAVNLYKTDYSVINNNNKFKFDNVFLTGSDGKNTNALCYYGTGTAWVQI